jgi:16S rRNA (guanine1516-N2)-methyltransferase
VTAERIELRSSKPKGPQPVYVDFVGGPLGYSRKLPGSRLLFHAIGRIDTHPTVIDATAGLGRDAFLLAHKGYRVIAIERSPVIAALLEDGIKRAMSSPELKEMLCDRLRLVVGDARVFLRQIPLAEAPDVVYLDPMFPPRTKSAKVKKESTVLRCIVGNDEDAGELLEAARGIARRHVVVKRMRPSPPIAPGVTRTYQGKSTRYDIYNPSWSA